MSEVTDFLAQQLADSEVGWSLGTFGAIAEFSRDTGEKAEISRGARDTSIVTARGGMRFTHQDGLRLIASESPTAESWSHRIALCLPEQSCAMSGRTELTEIGPDQEALRAEDRTGILFDLGLGTLQVDACIRANDPEIIAALRDCTGKSVFAAGNGAMGIILAAHPHRVFISRIGRAEVYQPIPPAGGKSPNGPHTHVLPKLLAHGRTHAATEPVPPGWIPCAHLYPPHPMRDGVGRPHPFQQNRHTAFQNLLSRYGDPDRYALKRRVIYAVAAGHAPLGANIPPERFARAAVRVALRQLKAADARPPVALDAWLAAFDRSVSSDEENPLEAPH
jgi:hypothetical protein